MMTGLALRCRRWRARAGDRPALGKSQLRHILAFPDLGVAVGRDEQGPVAAVIAQGDPHRHLPVILLIAGRLDALAAPAIVANRPHHPEALHLARQGEQLVVWRIDDLGGGARLLAW